MEYFNLQLSDNKDSAILSEFFFSSTYYDTSDIPFSNMPAIGKYYDVKNILSILNRSFIFNYNTSSIKDHLKTILSSDSLKTSFNSEDSLFDLFKTGVYSDQIFDLLAKTLENFSINISTDSEDLKKYYYNLIRIFLLETPFDLPFYFPGISEVTSTKVSGPNILSSLLSPSASNSNSLDLYPLAVREILPNGYVAIERPPFRLKVDFKPGNAYSSAARKSYEIWVPWTLTFINPSQVSLNENISHDVYLYVSDGALDELGERNYVPCVFPNTYSDARICFSNSLGNLSPEQASANTVKDIYTAVFNDYFGGGWNCDINSTPLYAAPYTLQQKYEEYIISSDLVKATLNQKKSFIQKMDILSGSTKKQYTSFFKMMTFLNLTQTLEFYSDLISQNRYSLDYNSISEKISSLNTYKNDSPLSHKIKTLSKTNPELETRKNRIYLYPVFTNLSFMDQSSFDHFDSNKDSGYFYSFYSSLEKSLHRPEFIESFTNYMSTLIDDYNLNNLHFAHFDFKENTLKITPMRDGKIDFNYFSSTFIPFLSDEVINVS